jgi:hypothetical protein
MLKFVESKIPRRYIEEFHAAQLTFLKSRVRLLCLLMGSVYFFLFIFDVIFDPGEHVHIEMMAGGMLIIALTVTFFLNDRARDLRSAKAAAFLFITALVLILVRLGVDYYESSLVSSAGYVFAMLIVVMTIPLYPKEVLPLAAIHLAGFCAENLIVSRLTQKPLPHDFASGMAFLAVAATLCLVLRRKETERDIDNFVLLKAVEEKNAKMKGDLELATRVHKTIIPDGIETELVSIKVTYLPAYYVGGDYARYVFLPGDRITFIISDVTGHGVPAALLVNRMHAEFERIAKDGRPPGELMRSLDLFIKEDFNGSGMYLTAFCGQLDMKNMTLLYSSYAHPPQYIYEAKTGKLREMSSLFGMLGMSEEDNAVYENKLEIGPGDRILLYTDGVTETFNASGEEFGKGRLERFFIDNHLLSLAELESKLMAELNSFKSGSFRDDICLFDIGIKTHGSFLPWGKHQGQVPA